MSVQSEIQNTKYLYVLRTKYKMYNCLTNTVFQKKKNISNTCPSPDHNAPFITF